MEQTTKSKQQNAEGGNVVPLTDIFFRTLQYWPWVLLSILICVGIGVTYLLCTPNVYTQSASLLIKDEDKGKSSSAGLNDFADLGIFSNSINIENEISTIQSPDLMEEVVKRLHLDYNYYTPGTFHNNVVYGSTLPLSVTIGNIPDKATASFELHMAPSGALTVAHMEYNPGDGSDEIEAEADYKGKLNDTIRTIAGPLVVKATPYLEKGKDVELRVVKNSLQGTINAYEKNLSVSLNNNKGTVIELSIKDKNVQRADEVLATIIGVYNENWIRDKNQIAVSTSNFINERLGVIENELGHVDSDISSYKSANLVPDLGAAAMSYMNESQALGQEILGMNNQLQMTKYIRNYLTAEGSKDKALPTNGGIENLDIQKQIGEYNQMLLERNNLVAKSSEKNPIVQNMDKDLAEMRGAIVGSVDNSIVNLQTQIRGLQGARGAATSKLASNPTQAKYLLSVERQQKVKESLYLFLLQKREDNELNQAFTAYNSRVIKRPGGSTNPTAPNKPMVLLVSFVFGLVIPFGVVYVKEVNNTKVRGRKDVEHIATPMMGEIPMSMESEDKEIKDENGKRKEDRSIVVKAGSRNIVNEAFRVLRTNLEFTRVNKEGCNVIAITSFNPGSGKSFIVMNLAAAIAIKNKKVLVIDGDMRHGSTSAYVNYPQNGIANYLSGNTHDIKSIITEMPGIPDLKVIPVGTTPPNPTELLESPRLATLMEELKKDYDYIFIDCPPIEVVADAQILDQYSDRTIFIIRAGLFERSMIPEIDRIYNENKYKRIAFILNGTRNERSRYGYAHSYKYGYGYGYGYGYNYDNGK